jgi:bifunctional non-homologous end joining protein LigD
MPRKAATRTTKKAVKKAAKATKKTAPLQAYREKRDFTVTAEPEGRPKQGAGELAYVIQKHAASSLHYDLRLELDGVMKSWAVPKGPSLDPAVKRLAVEVEDHPVDYNSFEGTIPGGEYGGGTVMIWDRGTYEYGGDSTSGVAGLRRGLEKGTLEFTLSGKRLKGTWVLIRTRRQGKAQQWLLIKQRDRYASGTIDVTEKYLTSVVSGRTMDEIAS